MNDKYYAQRDIESMDASGGYYFRHVSAMTSEGLSSKSSIAAELGYRDALIDKLEARCAALAAENAALKAAFNPKEIPEDAIDAFMDTAIMDHDWDDAGSWSWVANDTDVIRAVLAVIAVAETPATDAFLAEVRAQGVEELASLAGIECQRYKSVNDRTGARKWKSIVILCTDFAAQLRQEAAQ